MECGKQQLIGLYKTKLIVLVVLITTSIFCFRPLFKTLYAWKPRVMDFIKNTDGLMASSTTTTTATTKKDIKQILHSFYQIENVTTHSSLSVLLEAAFSSSLSSSSSSVSALNDEDINPDMERERCHRYKFNYSGRTKRRRIFWGSLLADDSWHVLSIAAMEYYGVLSTVALVESNTTQTLSARTMRFPKGSKSLELLSSPLLWGPNTQVSVDYYYDPPSETRTGLERENLQRNKILQRWKANGMTEDDIGYLSDIDEVASRDFLRALQICDVPEFAPGQDCFHAKIESATIVFEGSPMCLTKNRIWWHPDMIIGECVDQIGNTRFHPRVNRVNGMREKDWETKNKVVGPLWDATDFRMISSGNGLHYGKDGSHVAYHFHDYFDSMAILRNKYVTFGAPKPSANHIPLSDIGGDTAVMVNCLTGRNSPDPEKIRETVSGGYETLKSPYQMPIAFQRLPKYPMLRHAELQKMLAEDERLHPPRPQ